MFVGGISYMTTGNANPVDMLLSLGLGIPALLIIVLSSVTTNVMNLYSASISFVNVWPKAKPWQIIGIGGIVMTGIALIPNLIGHFISTLLVHGVGHICIVRIRRYYLKHNLIGPKSLDVECESEGGSLRYGNGNRLGITASKDDVSSTDFLYRVCGNYESHSLCIGLNVRNPLSIGNSLSHSAFFRISN